MMDTFQLSEREETTIGLKNVRIITHKAILFESDVKFAIFTHSIFEYTIEQTFCSTAIEKLW